MKDQLPGERCVEMHLLITRVSMFHTHLPTTKLSLRFHDEAWSPLGHMIHLLPKGHLPPVGFACPEDTGAQRISLQQQLLLAPEHLVSTCLPCLSSLQWQR